MDDQRDLAVVSLGLYLKEENYTFHTITPLSHQRIFQREGDQVVSLDQKVSQESLSRGTGSSDKKASSSKNRRILREFFGWNKAVCPEFLPQRVISLLTKANLLKKEGALVRSQVRFSTLDGLLFVHSKFPTDSSESVFFGPDSYRFTSFLKEKITSARTVVDLGCGSGVGGLFLNQHFMKEGTQRLQKTDVEKIVLTDINPIALRYSLINAKINQMENVVCVESDLFSKIPEGIDVVISNPPFIMDNQGRAYRDGGGDYGTQFSVKIVCSALDYLKKGGVLALYTGTCFLEGEDVFLRQLEPLFKKRNLKVSYSEIDPDIFGEELLHPAYSEVERIAAVGLVLEVL